MAVYDALFDQEEVLEERQRQEQGIRLLTPYYNAWRDMQDVLAGVLERGEGEENGGMCGKLSSVYVENCPVCM